MFKSIKWRLSAIYFVVTAVFLLLLGIYLMTTMERYAYDNTQNRLLSNARLMSYDLRGYFTTQKDQAFFQNYAHLVKADINARVTIIDTQGKVLGDSLLDNESMANHAQRPEFAKALSGEIGKSVRYSSSLKQRMFYFAVPVESDRKVIGAVRVAVPWSEIQEGYYHIRLVIGTAVLLALILMVIVAFTFTSNLVVPLEEMTEVAREMAEGKLDMTIDVASNDEIGALSKGLNYMSQRLRDTISQITEERNKIKAILTSMNDGVIAIDRTGGILLINPAVERMFNIKHKKIVGKSVIEVVRNFDLEKLLHEAVDTERSLTRELQIFVPEPKSFRISTAPLTNETGVVGVVAVMRDITAFRELERMKTDFVANVSHELRTPLTSIKGFVETLLDGALENVENSRHFLEIIKDETDRLNRLINDLLSLAGMEGRSKEFYKAPLLMNKVIEETVSFLAPQAREKKLILNINIDDALPAIEANRDMIGQLMINLIDNAIKYTPEGGEIDISAERADEGVKISVTDSGIGIPKDSMPRLFERFYRVDKARSRDAGGTGLGLAIVKHILEIHGGSIEVSSLVGQGSIFTVYLPLKRI